MRLEYMGKEFNTVASLANYAGMKPGTLYYRLTTGWDLETAVKAPVRERNKIVYRDRKYKSLLALAKEQGMNYPTLYARIKKGWTLEKALEIPIKVRSKVMVYQGKSYGLGAKFGRFWERLARTEEPLQIGWLRLRFGCRNKRRGCKATPPRFTAARNADCKGDFVLFRFADARGCKLPAFRLLGLHILPTPILQPFEGDCIKKTARK